MPISQANIHLYNYADETIQNAIVNTHPDFFTTDLGEPLGMGEAFNGQHLRRIYCLNVNKLQAEKEYP